MVDASPHGVPGAPRLEIDDHGEPATDPAFVADVVRETLAFAGQPGREVSLRLTGDAEIARVHGDFLDDPTPTDVISFELDDAIEIIVSVECARARAAELGHGARDEIALYIVHGILHGCGYDDIDARDRARMRDAERAVLDRLGCRVTPVDRDETTGGDGASTRVR